MSHFDIVKNPIPKSDLFATRSLTDIQAHISTLPAKEQAMASMVFMFTLNACNKLVEDEILSKEIFAQ
jgi:hypothetical protein